MTDKATIQQVYDEQSEYEYARLEKTPLHEAEFELTSDLLQEYVQSGDCVLDVGAGPGRYAEYLIKNKYCKVGLVDLSPRSLQLFERIGASVFKQVLFCKPSCATDLTWVEPASFDVVLLMGPLYHLVKEEERNAALRSCRHALKPGGLLVASFISPYQVFALPLQDPDRPFDASSVSRLLQDGVTYHNGMQQWRCMPTQARSMLESCGYKVIRTRNLEGVGCLASSQVIER